MCKKTDFAHIGYLNILEMCKTGDFTHFFHADLSRERENFLNSLEESKSEIEKYGILDFDF